MNDYLGEDLILATGAPGSRWSGSIRAIQSSIDINTTDDSINRCYDTGESKNPIGWHRGAYWGPGHDFGLNFDRLDDLSKDEVVDEFQRPFSEWDSGIKIIKSHWFSYHIPLLREWFPKAKLIAFHMPNDFCFDWWHKVGGWDITYPHYGWYENDERMRSQIEIENACIEQHFTNIKNRSLKEIHNCLGVSLEIWPDEYLDRWDNKIPVLKEIYKKSTQELLNTTVYRTPIGII